MFSEWHRIDLHIHTDKSNETKTHDYDAPFSVEALADKLSENSIELASLTDHNIINCEAYDALRRTLVEQLRVRSAVPLEFSRGRAVLAVDGDYGPEALLAALVDSTEPGLRVVPVRQEAETLTVLVDWTVPLAPAERSAPPPAEQARDAD